MPFFFAHICNAKQGKKTTLAVSPSSYNLFRDVGFEGKEGRVEFRKVILENENVEVVRSEPTSRLVCGAGIAV